ncbi:MAG: MBL fold metallo-hydrolase [Prevotella sp.]|nr:MBL fold metallo-hydrolase [Bacteroides sp.]MCM1366879.1 MBL fold metallo-hydrolase [Prevotella sp.]
MKVAKFSLSLFGVNCYIVYDTVTKHCAVIDPGIIDITEKNAIQNFINKNRLEVKHLINTHLHIDHCIGNEFISSTYNVPVSANNLEAPLGSNVSAQAQMFGIPMEVNNINIDIPLAEGDIIKIGDGELKVILVPGHSPGGIALYDKDDKFLITGDIIFQGSIGRTDLPGGDHTKLISGIKSRILTLPDDVTIYPGHGPETTVGFEKKHNMFLI